MSRGPALGPTAVRSPATALRSRKSGGAIPRREFALRDLTIGLFRISRKVLATPAGMRIRYYSPTAAEEDERRPISRRAEPDVGPEGGPAAVGVRVFGLGNPAEADVPTPQSG